MCALRKPTFSWAGRWRRIVLRPDGSIGSLTFDQEACYSRQATAVGGGVKDCGRTGGRVLRGALLCVSVLLVLALVGASGTSAAVGVTFTVNSTGDLPDAGSIRNGICADSTGACTLRAAIQESNASMGSTDTIAFNYPLAPMTPATELPPIIDAAVIDGTTHPAFVDKPIVEIQGNLLPAGSRGLTVLAGATVVRGLVVNGFSTQINFGTSFAQPGDGIVVVGNYIGTDLTGAAAAGGNASGIFIQGGKDHVIGGSGVGDRNVISGNGFAGITIDVAGSVTIRGNYIGTNASGDGPVANAPAGSRGIYSEATGPLLIGGAASGDGNVISGNRSDGIRLFGGARHQVLGNKIGTDSVGKNAVPNLNGIDTAMSGGGVDIVNNVASGNRGVGILLTGDVGSTVKGNMVGVDVDGRDALPNADGVVLADTSGVLVGGTTVADRNVISANGLAGGLGIGVDFRDRTVGNTVQGNFIGINVDGVARGNKSDGVWCCGTFADGLGNVIGGTAAGAGNVIAFNGGHGIRVSGTLTLVGPRTSILRNSIHSNVLLGIDLAGPAGPTSNDPGDEDPGTNDLQNFPDISSVVSNGGQTTVTGSLNSRASVSGMSYRLEFFANTSCDKSGFGEGQLFLGAVNVTLQHPLNSSATAPFTAMFSTPPNIPSPVVTATATIGTQTSEFSRCPTTTPKATIIVAKQTVPDASAQAFCFTGAIAKCLTDQQSESTSVDPGTYTVSELVPTGWDATAITCVDPTNNSTWSAVPVAAGGTASATYRVIADETVTCTFTNTQRGLARVVKTVRGASPSGSQSFCFDLRSGASTASAGSILESQCADGGNGGVIDFTTTLIPATTYALCELVMPGWMTTLGPPFYVVYNPSGDNSTVCTDFTVNPGQTKSFEIDNRPPPGGLARTIGFWKNWASCAGSRGKQKPVLDQTLAAADPAGIAIGTLTLHAGDCGKAVRLLDKSTVDSGKKMASDPDFGLAAQLLAARLNIVAGAGSCPAAVTAINDGQALLTTTHFNGSTHDKLSAAQATQANGLASTLDRYNNNHLC